MRRWTTTAVLAVAMAIGSSGIAWADSFDFITLTLRAGDRLGPITTPAYSLGSNSLAEGFVGTFKRDYLETRSDAATVLAQLSG